MTQNINVFLGTVAYAYNLDPKDIEHIVWNVGATFNPKDFDDETAYFLQQFGIDDKYHDLRLSRHNIKTFFANSQNPFTDLMRLVSLTKISGSSFNYPQSISTLRSTLEDRQNFINFSEKEKFDKSAKSLIDSMGFDEDDDEKGYFESVIPTDFPHIQIYMRASFLKNVSFINEYILNQHIDIAMHTITDISFINKRFAVICLFDTWRILPVNDAEELTSEDASKIIKENMNTWIDVNHYRDENNIPDDIRQQYFDFISSLKQLSAEWKKVMAYFLAAQKWKNVDIAKKIKYSESNVSAYIVEGAEIAVMNNSLPSLRPYFDDCRRDSKAI